MTERLYSAPEVARLLGIELDTLYRYARAGKLRGVKVGKLWRFPENDVEAFIQSHRYNATAEDTPVRTLPDLLSLAARRSGSEARIFCGGTTSSYADLEVFSDRLAASLSDNGIQPGDRVLAVLPNCIEFVVACFAAWKIGAAIVPEFSGIRPANLRHVVTDARPAGLIVDYPIAKQLEKTPEILDGVRAVYIKEQTFALTGLNDVAVESLDAILEQQTSDDFASTVREISPDSVAWLSYTSGSTGRPKGVMQSHDSLIASAEFTRDHAGLTSSDTMVIPLPLHHGLAFRQIFALLLADAAIAIAADVYQGLKLLRERRPTGLVLVPAAANIAMDNFAPLLQDADAHLRYIEIGSAAIAPERLVRLQSLLPTTRIDLPYGLTEARVGFLDRGSQGLYNRIVTVSPGLELRVVDPQGQEVQEGQSGEILLKGRGLMNGYWGESDEKQDALREDGFRTGDLGYVAPDGRIELLGRMDDVYKVGGRKVHPAEIEIALSRHAGVAEAAVTGLTDPRGIFETQLHAFVVTKKGEPLTEDELLEHCRRYVEAYKLPARVHFRNSLPKSAVGKILRQELVVERPAV
jgi:excisionase family DNA binding protein